MIFDDIGCGGDGSGSGSGSGKKQHLSNIKKKRECSIGYDDEKKAGNIYTMHKA